VDIDQGHIPRHLKPRVLEALTDTRIVVIQGARQVGKSTLATSIIESRGGRLVSLDDDVTRIAASTDPPGFVRQLPSGLLGIDEVQRVPSLILALKAAVDTDPHPGRFLVTGSANLLRMPAMQDSLAGRAENLDLFPLSQGELMRTTETFIDRLLDGDLFVDHRSRLTRQDYLERACAGGYPEALRRRPGRRRTAWFDNYLSRIVGRDAADISGLQRLSDLPRLLRLLAARNATELNQTDVASDMSIPARTLPPYLDLLETLFLIQRVPAWSTNLSKRVAGRPKMSVLDGGLAARLVNVAATGAGAAGNPEVAGQLLEGFVVGELRRQLGWAEESPGLYHYRDHDGPEVDVILETDDGRVAGLEIKAASTVQAKDGRWLGQLRDKLDRRFVAGLILHTGPEAAPFGKRIAAVPIDVLWSD
jgi:predicted AAA+ superfamily ATPase